VRPAGRPGVSASGHCGAADAIVFRLCVPVERALKPGGSIMPRRGEDESEFVE
jgi:hypothetical protein